MERLESIAADNNLDLVVDRDYHNLGMARFQPPNSFQSLLGVKFNFQSSNTKLTLLDGDTEIDSHYIKNDNGEYMENVLGDIERRVETQAERVK